MSMTNQEVREAINARKHLRSKVSLQIREIARRNARLPDH